MQAPIVLSTGAIARYPLEREPGFLTRRLTFADLSQQVLAHQADEMGRWTIDTALLTDAEAADWFEFQRSVQGPVTAFTFLDPWDNLLKQSEVFENSAWVKDSGLIVGKNYALHSEAFDNAAWAKFGSGGGSAPTVTANNVNGPDGNLNAEKIDFPATAAGQSSLIGQNATSLLPVYQSKDFVFSVFLRADSSIAIVIEIFDGVGTTQFTANLTTSWQRFEVTRVLDGAATEATPRITQIASQSAKTVYALGAQFEYGQAASDYTATTTAAVELQIADPFWQAAPSGASGSALGFNSGLTRRGRQIVNNNAGAAAIEQIAAVAPAGSGSSRSKGIEFTGSLYIKRQAGGPPFCSLIVGDTALIESGATSSAQPGASWSRLSIAKRFSPSNNQASVKLRLSLAAGGTVHVFGGQLETSAVVSGYKKTTTKSGVRANCRFAEDRLRHSVPQFDHNSIGQLVIQEWNG